MVRVLFVCLGNICRSPMAEALFRHLVETAGLSEQIQVDSAGVGSWHVGQRPHPQTLQVLDAHQIPHEGIVARQVHPSDLQSFDYVVAMDTENVSGLEQLASAAKVHVIRLLTLVPDAPTLDVPDPYYTNRFDEVYDLVEAGCGALLDRIREEHSLL